LINPVSSSSPASQAEQVSSPATRPAPQAQQASQQPQDKVTLSRSGDVDHDGDSH